MITQSLMVERSSEPLGSLRIVAIYCRFPFVPVLWPLEVDHASHLFAPPGLAASVNARLSMTTRSWRNLFSTIIRSVFQTSRQCSTPPSCRHEKGAAAHVGKLQPQPPATQAGEELFFCVFCQRQLKCHVPEYQGNDGVTCEISP